MSKFIKCGIGIYNLDTLVSADFDSETKKFNIIFKHGRFESIFALFEFDENILDAFDPINRLCGFIKNQNEFIFEIPKELYYTGKL